MMKIHQLRRKVGEATMSAWPPQWGGAVGRAGKFAGGEVGTLKAVKRADNRLELTIEYEGMQPNGPLQWDPPPKLEDVEKVLRAQIDKPVKGIGNLDV